MNNLLTSAWGDKKGFVFISHKGKDGWHDTSFPWPSDVEKIVKHIKKQDSAGCDVYWSFNVYSRRSRKNDYVVSPVTVLGADCDFACPKHFSVQPSVFWESSPNKFHGLWLIMESGLDIKDAERVSKFLSYSNLCDKGGWDLSQVLRLPETHNYKYGHDTRIGPLLGDTGRKFTLEEIERTSPVSTFVFNRYQIPRRVTLLHTEKQPDRSAALWELESRCQELGMSREETYLIAKSSANNKYENRDDQNRILWNEVGKVFTGEKKQQVPERRSVALSFYEMWYADYPRPEWLIEGMWEKGGYGIIAGEPKTFKSTLALDMALSLSSGSLVLGKISPRMRGSTLMIHEEMKPGKLMETFGNMLKGYGLWGGLTVENDGLINFVPPHEPSIRIVDRFGYSLDDSADRRDVERQLSELHPTLLVLDPLANILGRIQENDASEMRDIFNWLIRLNKEFGCAIILIHHFNKNKSEERGGQRMRGSSVLHGWVECGLYPRLRDEGIVLEREFRSFAKRPDLFYTIAMGEEPKKYEDYFYEVTCVEGSDRKRYKEDNETSLDVKV